MMVMEGVGAPPAKYSSAVHRIVAVNGGVIPGQVRVAVPGGISVSPVGADQTPFSIAVVVAQGQFPFPGQVQIDLGIDVGGFVVIVAQIRIGLLMAGTDAYAQGIPFLGRNRPVYCGSRGRCPQPRWWRRN